jgi:hypothetical protein
MRDRFLTGFLSPLFCINIYSYSKSRAKSWLVLKKVFNLLYYK